MGELAVAPAKGLSSLQNTRPQHLLSDQAYCSRMEPFAEIAQLVAEGQEFVLATVIESGGSTPQKPGSKMVVLADGTVRGTVGGGAIEKQIIDAAQELFDSPNSTRVIETHL